MQNLAFYKNWNASHKIVFHLKNILYCRRGDDKIVSRKIKNKLDGKMFKKDYNNIQYVCSLCVCGQSCFLLPGQALARVQKCHTNALSQVVNMVREYFGRDKSEEL